jgi:signal transduction histidine kinase
MRSLSRSDVLDVALGVGVAAGLALITARIGTAGTDRRAMDAAGLACVVVAGLSLSLRRWAPGVGMLVAGGAVAVYAAREYPGGPVFVIPLVAAFLLASVRDRRRTVPVVLAATGGLLVTGVVSGTAENAGWLPVVFVGWMSAAVLLGETARSRRDRLAWLEERTRYLEETREREARRREAEERLRVARDVHDVVAHTLSGIALQAGVGAKLAGADPARESLAVIRRSAKDGLRDLRAALDLLHESADPPAHHPTPALTDLSQLLEDTRGGGLTAQLITRGPSRPLPAIVETAAYRIVQEALTNVVRHSHSSRALVFLTYAAARLTVEVLDEGPESGSHSTDGYGIAGMRERALTVGGRLDAGPRPEGGFRVWAELPTGNGGGP